MVVEAHDRSNRLEPYLVGFVNFWVYENEVYPFHKGNILFGGQNGQGKSVSMQSIIPLLLDGNTHPSRIDPFGSGKRKIGDYLKTNDELDKGRIAYLYLTYKKMKTGEIITTGIGLRAIDESRNDFWGFVIKGKEIGKGFSLTKSIGYNADGLEEFVPLSKEELKNQIEELKCGKFVTTQRDYADEVNKQVFQFNNVSQLKELTKLLIQIRSPKLSKEMKPDVLYDALKNSLEELPSSEFSMISNTIKDIDDHNRKLEKTKISLELSSSLLEDYLGYQKAMLGNAANRYLEALHEQREMMVKKDSAEKKLITQKAKLKGVEERLTDIDIELRTSKTKLDLLETSEVRSLNNEKQNKEQEKKRKVSDLKGKNDQYERNQQKLNAYKKDIDKANELCDEYEKEIKEIIDELGDLATEVQFFEGESYLLMAKENLSNYRKDKGYFGVWVSRLNSHVQSLKNVLEAIQEEERVYGLLKEKKEEMREVESNIEQIERELTRISEEFASIKRKFKEDFREWVQSNEEYSLSQSEISDVMEIVENLFDFKDMTPKYIEEELYEQKERLIEPLKEEVLNNKVNIEHLENKIKDWESVLEELQKQKEVAPFFRRKETVENRLALTEKNIPFVPFYEAVEFKDVLSDKEKERVESALLDAGLLDALIIPVAETKNVGENDAVVMPKENDGETKTLFSVLKPVVPENSEVAEKDICSVLKSISLEELENTTYVTTSGNYQHGLLKGNAVKQEQSSFIGKEARRRHRENKMAEILLEIELLKEEIDSWEMQNEEVKGRMQKLLEEYEGRPTMEGLDENRTLKEQKLVQKSESDKRKGKLQEAHEDLAKSYEKQRIERIQISEFLEGTKDAKTIKELIEIATNEYGGKVQSMEKLFLKFEHKKSESVSAQLNYEDTEQGLIELKGEINVLDSDIKILVKNLENIEEMLKEAGIEKIEEDIKKLRKLIQDLGDEQKKKIGEQPTVEQAINRTNEVISEAKEELLFLHRQLIIREEVFGFDLKMNHIEYEGTLESLASKYAEETEVLEAYKQLHNAVHDFKSKDLEGYPPTSREMVSGSTELSWGDFEGKKDRVQLINSERKRLNVIIPVQGSKKNPKEFHNYLRELEEKQRSVLKKDEENLIKNVMIQGVGEKIKYLITKAKSWKDDINAFMKSLNNSIELRLTWEPIDKTDKNSEDHLTTTKLVELLGRDFGTLKDIDIEALSKHFMSKIALAKERLDRKNNKDDLENLEQALKQVLDYRDWYKFKILYTLEGQKEKTLDEKNLNILSGGEKAMAIYIPLFSAAYSKYSASSPDAPYIIALDEAFAGVDEENISEMFSLMERLGFNYILTSQALWADYPTVSGINIFRLSYDKVARFVCSEPWRWDGKTLEINEEVLISKGVLIDEDDKLSGDPIQDSLFDSVRT
ncbi:TIGR02680 family protein [Alkalihalobacillus sp. MEB130]|uniref:TIGR02680 family protein n=1 Tax=Alkalihalobacillus sp. MEB130 TaxID=2976704 RepID=UPI0028E01B14|nr:TIGR02680 family protein [Alkalihalobacillus sp. MEB130]MDT8860533.1 TIGR02680 family protein [Alkalihalobacillus sp. MEB130]